MADTRSLHALFPALCAGGAGAVAHAFSSKPVLMIAAATFGAAVGAIAVHRGRGEEPKSERTEAKVEAEHPSRGADGHADPFLSEALAALPIGVMIIGEDRVVRFANGALDEIFGHRDITGKPVMLLRASRLLDRIDAALRRREASTLEFTLSRTGDAVLEAHVHPLEGGDVVVAIRDATQSRRAAEVHRDFVANASHELKTPLAASAGIIETLLGPAREDPGATERFLGLLSAQTRRMTRLIEDLLSLNRIELNERVLPSEPQELASIVAESVDALRPIAAEAGVELIFERPGEPVEILGDREELAQLFGNLVDNAIKYSPAGSTVRISSAVPDPETPGQTGITIEDQGVGIARVHLPRLTERFYRVNVRHSREKGGTGLGLAIVKHIVARHRGRLEIDSVPGEGSRFTVWLPARQNDAPAAST